MVGHLFLVQILIKLLDLFDELFVVNDSLFALLMDSHFVLIDGVIVV